MAKSLWEYAESLQDRNLLWPAAPETVPAKATAFCAPLAGVKAVMWDIYGTLLTIADGQLLQQHPQAIRMQIAMEKTIQEFNMWNSMTRRPGQPWEYLLPKYNDIVAELKFRTVRKGDTPEVNSADIWRKILDLLLHKDYDYDEAFYGDLDELSEKIAYFFHLSLQGVAAATGACEIISLLHAHRIPQGLLADAQPFTLPQLLRELSRQGTLPPLSEWLSPGCAVLSYQEGVRKPSPSLFEAAREAWREHGIPSEAVVYVGSRLAEDLAHAKRLGFRTILFAGNKLSLQATAAECKDPQMKPDRLLTSLKQLRAVFDIS